MAKRWGKSWKETVTDFNYVGSKSTANGDCSHEIKIHLLLGRRAVTNLDSILKSRDITLLTKVCIVKAMVFLVVLYGCESCTIMKAWVSKNWCFQTVVLKKTLESPLDCKELKPVNPKGNKPWKLTGRTDAEAPILWPPDVKSWLMEKTMMLGKTEGKRGEQQMMRRLDGIIDSMAMNLSKLCEIVEDRGAWSQRVGHNLASEQFFLRNQ